MKSLEHSLVWCLVLAFATGGSAAAQCEADWKPTDGFPGAGVEPDVKSVTSWDPDGAGPLGPRLVAGGQFQYMGDRAAGNIAAFDPATGRWEDLAGGVHQFVEDEKTGLTTDQGFVTALAVFQDDLIVAGSISEAGGLPVSLVARWDGTAWSPVGGGFLGFIPVAIAVYDGELIVAGGSSVRRLNGASWEPLTPVGMNGSVTNLTVYDGDLVAVGTFTTAGGVAANAIARFDGSQWHPLGSGLNSGAFGLTVLGDDLYVGGNFTLAGGVPGTRGVARWDGSTWHPVGGGLLFAVSDLATYNGDVVAGGLFTVLLSHQQVEGVARFDTASQQWVAMEGGFCCGYGMAQFAVHDFGAGDELVVVGFFRSIAELTANGIARWSDATQAWHRVSPGFNWTPTHFISYRGDLIAGGTFNSAGDVDASGVARWDGTEWHALGGGIGTLLMPTIDSLAVYEDELYVGGHFASADGGEVPVQHIARWNGETQTWSDVGGGVTGVELPRVQTMAVYDGELVVAGDFNFAGGVPAQAIARWNGEVWQPLAGGLPTIVLSMVVHDGDLYVSTQSVGMQRWDGSAWHVVPGGPASAAMTVYDGQLIAGAWDPFVFDGETWTMLPGWSWDPNGAAVGNFEYVQFEDSLIVCGQFENAAGIPEADGLVRFDGTSWHAMETANGTLVSITSGASVHQGELFTNGRLVHPDGSFSNWRRWGYAWSKVGPGLAGVSGIPELFGTGTLVAGCGGQLSLTSARPLSPALLFASLSSSPVAFKGGVLAAFPFFLTVPVATNGSGALVLNYTWPSGVPAGTSLHLQYAVHDPAAVQGVSLSNPIRGDAP